MFGYEGKNWQFFYWHVGWWCWWVGILIDPRNLYVDFKIPFGYVRLGRNKHGRLWFKKAGWCCRKNCNMRGGWANHGDKWPEQCRGAGDCGASSNTEVFTLVNPPSKETAPTTHRGFVFGREK